MAKPIPKISYARNGHFSHKSAHKIPNVIIHIKASFDNTIMIVTDIKSQVLFADTCGFRGTKRGKPSAAHTTAGNAIHIVAKQGME